MTSPKLDMDIDFTPPLTGDEMLQLFLNEEDPFYWLDTPVLERPDETISSLELPVSSRASVVGLGAASAPVKGASMDGVVSLLDAWIPELDHLLKEQPTPDPPPFMNTVPPSTPSSLEAKDMASMLSAMAESNAPKTMWKPPMNVPETPSQAVSSLESSVSSRASAVRFGASPMLVRGDSTDGYGWGPRSQRPLNRLPTSNPSAAIVSADWQGSMSFAETSPSDSSEGAASTISPADSTGMDGYWTTSDTASSASSCVGLNAKEVPDGVRTDHPDIVMGWSSEIGSYGKEKMVEDVLPAPTMRGPKQIANPNLPSMNSQFDPKLAAVLAAMEPHALEQLKAHCWAVTSAHTLVSTSSTSSQRMPPSRSHGTSAPTPGASTRRETASIASGPIGWTAKQHASIAAQATRAQQRKMTVVGPGIIEGWTGQQVSHQRVPPPTRPAAARPQGTAQVYGWSAPPDTPDVRAFDRAPTALSIGRKIPIPQELPSRSRKPSGSVARTSKDLRRMALKQAATPYRIPGKVQAIPQAQVPQYKIAPKMGERA